MEKLREQLNDIIIENAIGVPRLYQLEEFFSNPYRIEKYIDYAIIYAASGCRNNSQIIRLLVSKYLSKITNETINSALDYLLSDHQYNTIFYIMKICPNRIYKRNINNIFKNSIYSTGKINGAKFLLKNFLLEIDNKSIDIAIAKTSKTDYIDFLNFYKLVKQNKGIILKCNNTLILS